LALPFSILRVAYSIQEHKIYWITQRDLMTLNINENKITNITSFENNLYDLCLDWVARNLYITYRDILDNFYIVKFDLTLWEKGIIKFAEIFKSKNHYDRLYVSPSMGYVYYRSPEKIIFH